MTSFLKKEYNKLEKENRRSVYTYYLTRSLRENYGIVLASNNNPAVENITKELSLRNKIDTNTPPDVDYFSECVINEQNSWSILSATLENVKNISIFKKEV